MPDLASEIEQISTQPRPLTTDQLDRLAVLRHRAAGARVEITTGPQPLAPAPATDLFAGVDGLPEIDGSELTAAHVASGIRHHGALIVRQLIAPDDVAALAGQVDGVRDLGHPLDQHGEPIPDSAPMKCSAATLQALIEVYGRSPMGTVMPDYLGAVPVLLAERTLLDRQVVRAGLRWHQDAAFFGGTFGAVNSFLALAECGRQATGLTLVARRVDTVICDVGTGGAQLEDLYITPADVEERFGADALVTPALGAGDAILFDELTLHCTARPTSKDPPERTWAVTWFFPPSRFPAARHPLLFDDHPSAPDPTKSRPAERTRRAKWWRGSLARVGRRKSS